MGSSIDDAEPEKNENDLFFATEIEATYQKKQKKKATIDPKEEQMKHQQLKMQMYENNKAVSNQLALVSQTDKYLDID